MESVRAHEGRISNDPLHRWAMDEDLEVKARNRYANVQAWANSRIHLRVPEGACDYTNASPIVLEDTVTLAERRYIASQVSAIHLPFPGIQKKLSNSIVCSLKGPKEEHLAHFWHMVFHESREVAVIIMLTQTFELGKEKCAQYFPLDLEDPTMLLEVDEDDPFVIDEEHGKEGATILGEVTLLETTFDEKCRSEIRKLELRLGSESKIVWHFLFAGWPDHTKPEGEDRAALLELFEVSASKCSPSNPRVVHCSAGVGRTGTFIALDHLLKELDSGQLLNETDPEEDPVYETVDRLREQRMMMVINPLQLQFLYEVLREQVNIKLGKTIRSPKSTGDKKSPKIAKLSNKSDLNHSSTSDRSWSEISDTE